MTDTADAKKPLVHWQHPRLARGEAGQSACGFEGTIAEEAIKVNCSECRKVISDYVTELAAVLGPPSAELKAKLGITDTTFKHVGERYTSLMDFLLNGRLYEGGSPMLDDLTREEEDYLRAGIEAYTDAVCRRQADTDVDAENVELKEAVRLLDTHLAWADITTRDDNTDPWQQTRDFFERPFIKALRGKLTMCEDHWHCDPYAAAHECHGPDRTQPCPTCKAKPDSTVVALDVLKQLYRAMPWPFNASRPNSMMGFTDAAARALLAAEKLLKAWGMLP